LVEQVSTQHQEPFLEWYASWYDYQLKGNRWSKTHDTCAMRDKEHRYQTFKVCAGDKCVECKLNDYWPAREDRVIDLSSHAFKQLAPLTRWLVYVKVYLVED
jgi:rare lipoprotein A (peptidoglycan hydrolase)